MGGNGDQIAYWNEVSGPKWVEHQERLDRLMAPLTQVLLDSAAPGRGEKVVDIGCGCGDLALHVAGQVGASGQVVAIDISKPMLTHAAKREAAVSAKGRPPIEWLAADAMTYAFSPGHDALLSRFGVMFFEDRERAFRNLRKALRPGGRFAFLAWQGREACEWMQMPLDWIAEVLPVPPLSDGEIGPFGLADPMDTRLRLTAAGFINVAAEPVAMPLEIGTSVDDAMVMLTTAGPAAGALREAEADARAKGQALMRAALAARTATDGAVRLGGACWLYRGRA